MLWKIYFVFLAILSVPLYLSGASGESAEFVVDLGFFVVLMIGVFGFAWKRKVFTSAVWRIFFPICVIWNMGHAYYTFDGLPTLILTAIYFPTLIALFLYAFRSRDIWNREPMLL